MPKRFYKDENNITISKSTFYRRRRAKQKLILNEQQIAEAFTSNKVNFIEPVTPLLNDIQENDFLNEDSECLSYNNDSAHNNENSLRNNNNLNINEVDQNLDTENFLNDEYLSTSESDNNLEDYKNLNYLSNFSSEFIRWAMEYNITQEATTQLLHLINKADPADIKNLPSDFRTLIKSDHLKKSIEIKNICGGLYFYIGIKKNLECEHLKLYDKNNTIIKLSVNVDGVPCFKSSRYSLWPILGSCFEKKVFMIACFFGCEKPNNVDNYLIDFINECKILYKDGIIINNKCYNFQIKNILCDVPAKSFLFKVNAHNAYNSCVKCEVHGECIGHTMTFCEINAPVKTDNYYRNNENFANIFYEIPDFSFIKHVPYDYMHLACIGVMKKLILTWFERNKKIQSLKKVQEKSKNEFNRHYLGPKVKYKASTLLQNLRKYCPKEFQRNPRSLKEIHCWKSTEYRQFLLYTGPTILYKILPPEKYQHFLLFHVSFRILAQRHLINKEYCTYVKKLLEKFVHDAQLIYGKKFVVHNVHALIHYPDDCILHGAIDDFSCFPFESFLYYLKNIKRTGVKPIEQIRNRYAEIMLHGRHDYNTTGMRNNKHYLLTCSKEKEFENCMKYEYKPSNLACSHLFDENTEIRYFHKLIYKNFTYCDNNKADCFCLINNKELLLITHIIQVGLENTMYIVGINLEDKSPLYITPCNSNEPFLNIWKVYNVPFLVITMMIFLLIILLTVIFLLFRQNVLPCLYFWKMIISIILLLLCCSNNIMSQFKEISDKYKEILESDLEKYVLLEEPDRALIIIHKEWITNYTQKSFMYPKNKSVKIAMNYINEDVTHLKNHVYKIVWGNHTYKTILATTDDSRIMLQIYSKWLVNSMSYTDVEDTEKSGSDDENRHTKSLSSSSVTKNTTKKRKSSLDDFPLPKPPTIYSDELILKENNMDVLPGQKNYRIDKEVQNSNDDNSPSQSKQTLKNKIGVSPVRKSPRFNKEVQNYGDTNISPSLSANGSTANKTTKLVSLSQTSAKKNSTAKKNLTALFHDFSNTASENVKLPVINLDINTDNSDFSFINSTLIPAESSNNMTSFNFSSPEIPSSSSLATLYKYTDSNADTINHIFEYVRRIDTNVISILQLLQSESCNIKRSSSSVVCSDEYFSFPITSKENFIALQEKLTSNQDFCEAFKRLVLFYTQRAPEDNRPTGELLKELLNRIFGTKGAVTTYANLNGYHEKLSLLECPFYKIILDIFENQYNNIPGIRKDLKKHTQAWLKHKRDAFNPKKIKAINNVDNQVDI